MAEPAEKPAVLGGDEAIDANVAPGAFAFEARRARMDWRAIHAVDVDRVMRENDIDTLESVLETVTFGDVSVEDSRYLTTSNARKVIRLAQCQVEYLLHVQETLATHKERLRSVAESAQRDAIEAKSDAKEQKGKARAARTELRKTRKALKTYEVLEQIRSGTPLEEILTGKDFEKGLDTSNAGNVSFQSQNDGDENAAVRALARAAAKARDAEAFEKRAIEAEAKFAEAVAVCEKLESEKLEFAGAQREAIEQLERAKKAASTRAAASEETFEKRLAQLEVELNDAKAQAEQARANSEQDAKAADAARARALEVERNAREAELNELRRSVKSVGDGSATEAAKALAAATAAEQRLADLEQRDGEIIAELRQRLAIKDEENARLRMKRDELEQQLVNIASGVGLGGEGAYSVMSTPAGTPAQRRSPHQSLSRRSGDAIADELRAHLDRQEDPLLVEQLEKAKAEMNEARAAASDAKTARDEVERLRLSIASDEAKAAKEEIERLKLVNKTEIERMNLAQELETKRLQLKLTKETQRLEDESNRLRKEKELEIERFVRERDEETLRLREQRELFFRERDLEKARLLEETARLREQRELAIRERDDEKSQILKERDEEKRRLLEERNLETAKIREERAAETARLLEDRDTEKAKLLRERDTEKAKLLEEQQKEKDALLKERELEKQKSRQEKEQLLKEKEESVRKLKEEGLSEVAKLREANEKLSETAEKARAAAEASKRAELETKEKALRDAEASERKVIAAAAALEKEHALRELEEEKFQAMRKSSPERRAASDTVAAELKLLRETITLAASASVTPSVTPVKEPTIEKQEAMSPIASMKLTAASPRKPVEESDVTLLSVPAVTSETAISGVPRDSNTSSDTSLPGPDSFLRDANAQRNWDERLGSPTTIPDVVKPVPETVPTVEPVPATKVTTTTVTTKTVSKPAEVEAKPEQAKDEVVEAEIVEVDPKPVDVTTSPAKPVESSPIKRNPEKSDVEVSPRGDEAETAPVSETKTGKKKKNKKKKSGGAKTPDFSEAPSTAVTASVEPESRAQEGEKTEAVEAIENVSIAPTASPSVAEPAVAVAVEKPKQKVVESAFDAKQKELEIEQILSEKKKQIEEVLAEKKAAIDEIFEAQRAMIEQVALEKNRKAEQVKEVEREVDAKTKEIDEKTRLARENLAKEIENFQEEKAKALAEIQSEKQKAIDEVHLEETRELKKQLEEKQRVIEEIHLEKQKALSEVSSLETNAKTAAIEEIQKEKQKAIDEVREKEEAERTAALAEIAAMKQKAVEEVNERQKKEKQRTIVQMMQTHAFEVRKGRVEAEEAEKVAAEKAEAERVAAEAAAAKKAAAEAEAARLEAEVARLAEEQAKASVESSESDMDSAIVDSDVSDSDARPELEVPSEIEQPTEELSEVVPPPPPVPVPVIPAVPASLPLIADEPGPMDPKQADTLIKSELSKMGRANMKIEKEAMKLKSIINAAPTDTKQKPKQGTVPNASPRLMKEDAAKSLQAEKAKERLAEVEAVVRETAANAARAVARAAAAPPFISESDKKEWLSKHPHQPVARAPYALSRHSTHDQELFDAAEEAVVAYLEEQVTAQLVGSGVGLNETKLDDVRYVKMMHEFRERHSVEIDDLSEEDSKKYETERAAILNHIAATSRVVMAERMQADASANSEEGSSSNAEGILSDDSPSTAKILFAEPTLNGLLNIQADDVAAAVPLVMQGKSVRESLE